MYNFVYCKNSYLNILGEICGFFLCTFLPSMKTKRLEIKGEEWVPGFFRQLTVCLVGFQAVLNMSSTPWRCWGLHVHCTVYCNKIRFNEWYFIYIKSQFLHHPSSFQTNKQKIDYTIKVTTLTSLLNSIVYPIQYSLQYSSIVKSVFLSHGRFVRGCFVRDV